MAVEGIFVSDAGAVSERPGDLSSSILQAERGGSVPMFALSAGMETHDISDTTCTWYEEDIMYHRTIITSIADPRATNFQVEDATWMHENQIFFVETTGEYVFIKAINGNVLTVERGVGGTPVDDIVLAAGTEVAIQLIGSAFEEASERPTGHSKNPYPRTNITQIFRTSWDISGTAQAVNYRFGNRQTRNKAHAALEHATAMEFSLIWGRRHNGVIDGKPFRVMDGILNQFRSNIFQAPAGGLTRRAIDDFIERIYSTRPKSYSNERVFFGGNASMRALNEIAFRYGEYNISKSETCFGLLVDTMQNRFGSMKVMIHPMMNDSPVWSAELYGFHPGMMQVDYLRRTYHTDDTKGSASDQRDATAGVYTTEMTCKYMMEQTGAIMRGVEVDHFVV